MSVHLPWRHRPAEPAPVTTYELARPFDDPSQPLSGTIRRPEELRRLELSAATAPADGQQARTWVSTTIGRLLGSSALDDLTSDVLDAHIAAQAAGWNVSTDRQAPDRLHVELRLAAAHLQGIATTRATLTQLRAQHQAAAAAAARYTAELTGTPHTPEQAPAPAVDVLSVLAGEPAVQQAIGYLKAMGGHTPHVKES